MPRIKKDELERVMNSLYKEKERVLPANQKHSVQINETYQLKTNKPTVYLFDGYNLMHQIEEIAIIAQTDLISARDKVIDIVCDYQGYTGYECVLIFDAYKNNIPISIINKEYNIAVVYTNNAQTADMYIEQKSKELNDKYKIYVVTSDNLEQLKVLSNHAMRISCKEFMHRYENLKKNAKKSDKHHKHQPLKELRKLLFED